jgi:hypothetical protein
MAGRDRAWGREIYGGNNGLGRIASVVELTVAATVMGTLGKLGSDLSKGQNPLPRLAAHPIDYFLHGLMRFRVGSIAGEALPVNGP